MTDFHIPWFMFDIDNYQLIMSRPIPEELSDNKSIVIAETPIAGLNYEPMMNGGNKNRKIGFTLPVISRNNHVGNILIVKQFENLRNQALGILELTAAGQFKPNPRVLYYWGTGSIPLIYYVTKCDMRHDGKMVNMIGSPQLTYIDLELTLDETNPLYIGEEIFRKLASITGMAINAYNVISSLIKGTKPY